MAKGIEILVPDIGDFVDVPVIEIGASVGDRVAVDDPLVTLESDKATMEIPSPNAGAVAEIKVKIGDRVSRGTVLAILESEDAAASNVKQEVRGVGASAPPGGSDYGGESGVYSEIAVNVPDIGDFKDVPVIEVHVAAGDEVAADDPLIALESDKATMDVPAPSGGKVKSVSVCVGDSVSEGALILTLEGAAAAPGAFSPPTPAASAAQTPAGDMHAEMLVLGSGPGGYTAAFRSADLGMRTVLVERYDSLGGVCLNVGCIPSKALLHAAKVIDEAADMGDHGIAFAKPKVDIDKLRGWKESVVKKLTDGLAGLAKRRKVEIVTGVGKFIGPNLIAAETRSGTKTISFDRAIIAAGSEAAKIPAFPHDDERVITSTGALALADIPKRLLVVGGGIVGLEMATIYHALGSGITVVELMDGLIPGADKDLVKPLHKRVAARYENILLNAKVAGMEAGKRGIAVKFEGKDAPAEDVFDQVLVSVGRRPNGHAIGAEAAGVTVDARGFIPVDRQQRTNAPHIFAIGDIVGQPMLAHKAVHEGKTAAEAASGLKAFFDARAIPSVAYTDPEIAWVGVTETQAKQDGIEYGKGVFPWAASGRSLSLGRDEGMTKLLFDEETGRTIGGGIVGPNAGDLIAEVALAIEMGGDAADIGLTVHPHPTLSETVAFSAEAFEGTITDLYMPKKR